MSTLLVLNTSAQQTGDKTDDPEWFVPEGVVYTSGEAKDVEHVRKALEMAFKKHQKGIYKQSKKLPGYFFLGPLISSRLLDENPKQVSNLRTVGYRIKLLEDFEPNFQGLLAKTKKEKKLLSQLLSDRIGDTKKVTLRKLTPKELAFMWYFISWNIKEPVFVLETDERNFLIDVGAIEDNQLWVEEISDPCFKFGFEDIISPCLCFEVMMEEKKWSAGFIENPEQCDVSKFD